ncbi:hypothetical protein FQN60_003340 [Etheostoma spectabile]|uniref:Uncharacterized protein n=1 Tax=Etheostoma spectabile TaxID=54343 RepID=A0A5J5CLU8_9PERO|nr:hypothetical protein FQN60_003340 [Etheostoma spectabile]
MKTFTYQTGPAQASQKVEAPPLSGGFGEAGAQTDPYPEWLREYWQAFFYGLPVKLLPAVTVEMQEDEST